MVIKIKKPYLIFFTLLAVSIPAILPLLSLGFYEPHDLHHLADIYQMFRAFSSGQIPPRLGPDFTFGYGYPLFNFYYLLPFYLGAFWYFLSGSLTASFEFVFILSVIISVFGMYLFLKEFVGKFAALVGSILFLYTPYRALQIYVRGAMGEALALSLLPFVLWVLVKVARTSKMSAVALGSFVVGLFLIAHNYLSLISGVWIALFVLIIVGLQKKKGEALKRLFFVAVLSLGVTSYWWLPAVLEQGLVSSITPFPLKDHFPFIKQLIFPSWGYGSSVWGSGDGLSFQIGVVNLAVVLLAAMLIIFFRRFFKRRDIFFLFVWALLGFFVSVFFMNIRSLPLWKLVPLHDFVQFPWRLLFLTTFFTSVLAAFIVHVLPKRAKEFGLLIIVASLFLTLPYFRPSQIFYKSDEQYLSRFFMDKTYSEDYLLLPNWVKKRPTGPPSLKIESEMAKIEEVEQVTPIFWTARTSSKAAAKVTFNAYFFPGWFAEVDGKDVEITPGDPNGQIEIEVPEGEHEIEFFWKETSLRKRADFISLISFLLIVILFFKREPRATI